MAANTKGELDIRAYFYMLKRRQRIIIYTALSALIGGALVTTFQKPMYRSTVSMLLRTEAPPVSSREEMPFVDSILAVNQARSVETQKRLIISKPIIKQTIKELRLKERPESLIPVIEVETFRDADMLAVHVKYPDSDLSTRIANSIAGNYLKLSQHYNRETATSAKEFVENQMKVVRREMTSAEQKLQDFKKSQGIANLSEETKGTIDAMSKIGVLLAENEAEVQPAAIRLREAGSLLGSQNEVQTASTFMERNPLIEELQNNLVDLEAQYAGAIIENTEEHPAVRALAAQIELTKKRLAQQVETLFKSQEKAINPLYQTALQDFSNAKSAHMGVEARKDGLARTLRRLEEDLMRVPKEETRLAQLVRNVSTAEKTYTMLMEKLPELRIAETMRLADARIVEPAERPIAPISPKVLLNLVLSLIFGLVAGIAFAAVAEHLDDSIRSLDEVRESLGLPVLASIPGRLRDQTPVPAAAQPSSIAAEAFRMLRSSISFCSVDAPVRRLLVTSSVPSEGKSFTSTNLSIALAQGGSRVIVVDADLRKPTVHKFLRLENECGLTDVLLDKADLESSLQSTMIKDLRVLTSGPLPPNPAELLGSRRMHALLDQLSDMCDIIVIDSPPTLAVTDASVLAGQVDSAMLVIGFGQVRTDAVRQSLMTLESTRVRIIGAVLNRIGSHKDGYYSYKHYSYYGHYGNYGGDGESGNGNGNGKRTKVRDLAGAIIGRRPRS